MIIYDQEKDIKKQIIYHQHEDETGNVFGSKHDINSYHKNPKTRQLHNFTIGREGSLIYKKLGFKFLPVQE